MTRYLPVVALAVVFLVVAVIHVWSGRVSTRSSLLPDPTTPPTPAATTEAERSDVSPTLRTKRQVDPTASLPETTLTTPPTTATAVSTPTSVPTRWVGETIEEDPDQVAISVSPPGAIDARDARAAVASAVKRLRADVTGGDRNPYQRVTPRGALVKVAGGAVTVWLAWEGKRSDGSVDTHRTPIRIGETP